MSDSKKPFPTDSAVIIFPHQKLFDTAGPHTRVFTDGSEENMEGNWRELFLVAVGSSCMLSGLIPAEWQRINPSRGPHTSLGLQEVWRQEILLWMEQEQSLEQVLSVYQLSPTCGVWTCNRNLEARDRLGPHHPEFPMRLASLSDYLHHYLLSAFWFWAYSSTPSTGLPYSFCPQTCRAWKGRASLVVWPLTG